MNFLLRASYYAELRLGVRKYLNRKRGLLSIIRALRSVWLLGPWRKLFVRYHQKFSRNEPLPRYNDSLFEDLDITSTVTNLETKGYSPGLRIPDSQVSEVIRFCELHNIRKHRNAHLVCDTVSRIAHDPKIIEVVSRYLGAEPILYQTDLYWTYPPTDEIKRLRALAQKSRFHYDVGDFRSLVVFIYLTNVDEDCGPHIVIEATHHKKSAWGLLNRFLSDQTAQREYGSRIKIITGERGTGFFEDLTCYHKHAVGNKARLMLTITYMLQRTPIN